MEYIRKRRHVNYHSPKCKLYLRHDFNHECAYCKTHEVDISDIQIVAERFFEKDHFYPQATKVKDIHDYCNLYYSCEKCNGSKSSECDGLLDPCKQDIFSGKNPQFIGGDLDNDFLYYAKNKEAEYYRDVFQLNSRYHLKIRKARYQRKLKQIEAESILDSIKASGKINEELLTNLRACMSFDDRLDTKEILCGNSNMGHYFCEVAKLLDAEKIDYEFILEEYNQDIKIKIDKEFYYCEIQIDNREECVSQFCKKLSLNYILDWNDNDKKYGIIYYLPKLHLLYLYRIKMETIDFSKSVKNIMVVDQIN